MMYPRLRLLHRLLAKDGAIFISIDNSEYASLKLICDEIMGQSNYVDTVSWFKKASPSNDAQFFSNDIEYILIYAKDKNIWRPYRLPLNKKQRKNYQNPDNDIRGDWNSATYTCNKSSEERPNLYYPIINPYTGEEVYPNKDAVWKYSKEQTELYMSEDRLYWGVTGTARMPRFKTFLSEHKGVVNRTLWHYDDVNHTQGASNELKDIGISGFSTPKPSRLVERMLQIASDKDSIILDSFAGSGTTAHAVLNANKADNGHRKFILIEMEDYADTITAERVKRVISGYGEGKKAVPGTGGSFSFYELGQPIFDGEYLNDSIAEEEIRKYVYFTETKQPIPARKDDEPCFMGMHMDVAYYYYYDKNGVITKVETSVSSSKADGIPKGGYTVVDDYIDGNLISTVSINHENNDEKRISATYEYKDGKLYKDYDYNAIGEMDSWFLYEYNSKGLLIKKARYHSYNNLEAYGYIYEYDEYDNKISEKRFTHVVDSRYSEEAVIDSWITWEYEKY